MNPDQIATLLASGDKEQVRQAQKQLQALGYNVGPKGADGGLGGDTSKAIADYRRDFAASKGTERDIAIANQQANDPTNNAIRGLTEIGPYGLGVGGGLFAGHAASKALTAKDQALAGQMRDVAVHPDIAGEIAAKGMRVANIARAMRVGANLASAAPFLGSQYYIRQQAERTDDKGQPLYDPETRKWLNLGANADMGAGLGIAAHGVYDIKNRIGSPVDQVSQGLIRTRAARERGSPPAAALPAPAAPAAAGPPPGSRAWMLDRAGELDIKGASSLNKTDLAAALAQATQAHGAKRTVMPRGGANILFPLAAGALAYEAAVNEAKAGDNSLGGTGATAGPLAAGGTAAAGAYGVNKLLERLPAGVGEAMAPSMVDAMTDYSPEELNQARNWMARSLPSWMQAGAVKQAAEMAQLPEPDQRRQALIQALSRGPIVTQTDRFPRLQNAMMRDTQ